VTSLEDNNPSTNKGYVMKEYKFNSTNYDNIEGKSVWDLYVETFRDDLWDLAPTFAWDLEGGGFRVTSSPWDKEETTEEVSEPPKPKKKAKKATKKTTTGMTKTGRVGDKAEDVVAENTWEDEGGQNTNNIDAESVATEASWGAESGVTRPPIKVRAKRAKA